MMIAFIIINDQDLGNTNIEIAKEVLEEICSVGNVLVLKGTGESSELPKPDLDKIIKFKKIF
jgi:hypothetical protein